MQEANGYLKQAARLRSEKARLARTVMVSPTSSRAAFEGRRRRRLFAGDPGRNRRFPHRGEKKIAAVAGVEGLWCAADRETAAWAGKAQR